MKTWSLMAVCAAFNYAVAMDFADNGSPMQSASAPASVTNVFAVRDLAYQKHFYDASYWARIDTGEKGESGGSLDSGTDYLVHGKDAGGGVYYCCSPNKTSGSETFAGRSLTIGTMDSPGHFRIYGYRDFVLNFGNLGLFLVNGKMYFNATSSQWHRLDGKITILSPASNPFVIRPNYTDTVFQFGGKLHGDANSAVQLDCDWQPPLRVNLPDIGSDFRGRLILRDGSSKNVRPGVSLNVGTASVGAIEIRANTRLSTCAAGEVVTVETLKFEAGSYLDILASSSGSEETLAVTHSRFEVTKSLELPKSGKVSLSVPYLPLNMNGGVSKLELLSAPKGKIDKTKFELKFGGSTVSPVVKLDVDESGADMDILCLVAEPLVLKTVSDGVSSSMNNLSTGITNKYCWSDEKTPHEGVHYELRKGDEADMTFRLIAITTTEGNPYIFPGESLSLYSDTVLYSFIKYVTVPNLILHEGAVLRSRNLLLSGELSIPSGEVYFETYADAKMQFYAPISGAGTMVIRGYGGSDAGLGNTRLEVANPGFKGSIRLTSQHYGWDRGFFPSASDADWQTLTVVVPEALGAPLDSFNAKAVSIDRYGVFNVDNDIDFLDVTRGFYFGSAVLKEAKAQVKIKTGKTATFRSKWTMNGEVCVTSGGTLALGGEMCFGSSSGTEPEKDRNILTFAQGGSLKALARGCIDGAMVVFSNDTSRLVLEADATDAELRSKGVRNVKTSTPFVFPGEKLNVEFSLAGAVPLSVGEEHNLGIMTVKSVAAERLRGKLSVTIPRSVFGTRGQRDIIETTDPETGDVTFSIRLKPVGFTLTVR